MPAVSQGLADWANGFRQPAQAGLEIIETPLYRVVLQPDYPVPGPNSAAFIRCRPDEADDVITEVSELFATRGLPLMWVLDPGTEPANFSELLAARGFVPDPHGAESAVMVLPMPERFDAEPVAGLELLDGLTDIDTFRRADAVNREAFTGELVGDDPGYLARLNRRLHNQRAVSGRHVILATIDGEPAASAGLTIYPPHGAVLNGGAVRAKFRGLGIYRAMVAARVGLARQACVEGLSVWGGPMSKPILERLGFEKVGWRRFYLRP